MTPTTGGDWWDDARFGLFVHWGVMSLHARGDWSMHREHIPIAEYERLGDRFTASTWDPAAQAALARRAGMRYGVLVTRHHDGFCLWDTATDSFKATNTPAGRDLVAEWVEAFRAEGLRTGLYYSLLDWRAPAYWHGPYEDPAGWAAFREHVHAQIRELLTGYGEGLARRRPQLEVDGPNRAHARAVRQRRREPTAQRRARPRGWRAAARRRAARDGRCVAAGER